MGTLLNINGRVFEINNRENGIMKGWGKRRRIKPKPEPEPEQHEYVDLGLPSGTLWATENIKDANGNELYFAWGETQGYTSGQVGTDKYFASEGDHADYKYGTYDGIDEENKGMTKYNKTDGKTVLDVDDDAATVNWGEEWKMPTKEEVEELTANTTSAWTQVDGVDGVLFTSKVNTNTLFFPALGSAEYGKVSGVVNYGCYWSAYLHANDAIIARLFSFSGRYCGMGQDLRSDGYSVRPVRK